MDHHRNGGGQSSPSHRDSDAIRHLVLWVGDNVETTMAAGADTHHRVKSLRFI